MKRIRLSLFVFALCLIVAGAAFAGHEHMMGGSSSSCQYCGMDLEKFAHSRMTVAYDDGTKVETCSIHCAALDLALNIDKTPDSIMVGDFDTKKMIDADKAFWVVGGDKPGVMTMNAKWAFSTQQAAQDFIKTNGGTAMGFDEVIKAAFEDMYHDTKMIRDKRKMMKMKGEMKH